MKNKRGMVEFYIAFFIFMLFFCFLIYDQAYCNPLASEKANIYCEEKGFDFYKSFSRVGIFSKEPVGIKCTYVEQYKEININRPLVEISKEDLLE